MTAFVVSGIFTIYSNIEYMNKKKEYDNLEYGEPQSIFDSKYDAKVKAANMSIIGAGIVAAIYLFNWADILFITEPEFENRNALLNYGNHHISFNVNLTPGSRLPDKNVSINCSYKL